MNDDNRPPRPMPRNLRLPGQMPTNIKFLPERAGRQGAGPKPKRQARCPPPPARLSPAAAEIWRDFKKTLWRRDEWHPEFLHPFAGYCDLEARGQTEKLSASLESQLRLSRIEWGVTLRSRKARMIEQHGTI